MQMVMKAFEHSQEEFKALKVQIAEGFKKNLEEEKNRLHKRHEKAIKDLEKEELAKAEERAIQNANATYKGEHDKKMNAIQVERMLYEKQSKKRLEETQQQIKKQFELECVVNNLCFIFFKKMKQNFENQKNNEIKLLNSEVNNLLNQLLTKEGQLTAFEKQVKDVEIIEKDMIEMDFLINQLDIEITELEGKGKETKSSITNYQNKLHDLKKKVNFALITNPQFILS